MGSSVSVERLITVPSFGLWAESSLHRGAAMEGKSDLDEREMGGVARRWTTVEGRVDMPKAEKSGCGLD